MLLRFGFSNSLSIKGYQEISLAASSLIDEPDYLISRTGLSEKILPCVAIYGTNASGKTNFLHAFDFFRDLILTSHAQLSPEEDFGRNPFLLDPEYINEPSVFDCDVLYNDVRYHYGFSLSDNKVQEEWLYSYPTGNRRVLFHRDIREEEVFSFGRHLKGKNKSIEALTRNNSLFISSAAQNNHEELSGLYNYFKENFIFRLKQGPTQSPQLADYLDNNPLKNEIIEFVKYADIGIVDSLIEEEKIDDDQLEKRKKFTSLLGDLLDVQKIKDHPLKMKKLKLGHRNVDGNTVYFDLYKESRGTLCLLSIVGPILDSLANGKVLIIDEIDSSMHSELSLKLVSLFNSEKANPKGAQLVFTTHDTHLLGNKALRRDEIWFTEKSRGGETQLYPLSEIKTRNTDNLQKGYLQGRYGGIPFLGNIDKLFASKSEA